MIEGRPSQTAAFVATWRALADYLPPEVRLCHDPLGWSFSAPTVARLRPIAERFPAATGRFLLASPLRRLLLWMQLRTRAIDDIKAEVPRTRSGTADSDDLGRGDSVPHGAGCPSHARSNARLWLGQLAGDAALHRAQPDREANPLARSRIARGGAAALRLGAKRAAGVAEGAGLCAGERSRRRRAGP